MEIAITLPDDLAHRLGRGGSDLPRRTLEALAAQSYRDTAR